MLHLLLQQVNKELFIVKGSSNIVNRHSYKIITEAILLYLWINTP